MQEFWLSFVPIFVAMDVIGIIPLFLSLTEKLDARRKRKVIVQSLATALAVALAFLAIGSAIMNLLKITMADFMVAGGVLLFIIAMKDLVSIGRVHSETGVADLPEGMGAVPLGVPLLVGPGVLATILLLAKEQGLYPTLAATLLNVALAGLAFSLAGTLYRFLGDTGARIVSKLASLLLASIAVMMVRRGIETMIRMDGPWK